MITLAAVHLGPIELASPEWLVVGVVAGAVSLLMARRSLSLAAGRSRWLTVAARLVVIALLAMTLAEPGLRDESDKLAVTAVLDMSRSVPTSKQAEAEAYVEQAAGIGRRSRLDLLGTVTAAREAYVQALPSPLTSEVEARTVPAADGTNLEEAVRMALAVRPGDAAYRLLLITDGNETQGSLLAAADRARAAGVPIDVLPQTYRYESEVILEAVDTPASARAGEIINARVTLRATRPVRGRLTLLVNDRPVRLGDGNDLGVEVSLSEGTNTLLVPLALELTGPQEFEAVFEPLEAGVDDVIADNNRATAITFYAGEATVLVLSDRPEDSANVVRALSAAGINVEEAEPRTGPASLVELSAYDAVVLCNTPAYSFSQTQIQNMVSYVEDGSGGLVMLGGPDSFGAGGWIGTEVEDILPVQLDPPQTRRMPRGALALIMHSVEMPEGRFYGERTAEAAVDALSRLDLVGIVEFSWSGGGSGVRWVHPMSPKGSGAEVRQSIKSLTFGDMQDMAPSVRVALDGLIAAEAGQKHAIIISDGDPSPPGRALLQRFVDNGITISTVGVFPHNGGPGSPDLLRLRVIAETTGGNFYAVTQSRQLATLPQIFIKEAQTVKRSLIWEGNPFAPTLTGMPSPPMRGISAVPKIEGYVVTTDRQDGLAVVSLRGPEDDPILAHWQRGLGRVVAYTSDLTTRWSPTWTGWPGFESFIAEHVRWAMRPSGNAEARTRIETDGDTSRVVVDLADADDGRINFASIIGRVAGPEGDTQELRLRQDGPGRYVASFRTDDPGSYVVAMRYDAPTQAGGRTEGAVQAAVTRPFSDEFRAIEDNAGLLRLVAERTGGRVLPTDPTQADIWQRTDLERPVAREPAVLLFAMITLALFLVDVAVRRVRLDLAVFKRLAARAAGKGGRDTGESVDSLRIARERARAKIDGEPGTSAASRKFEADPDAEAEPIELGAPETDRSAVSIKSTPEASTEPEEEGLSRLMRAKKRARDEMADDD
ncbi:MAG: VWA domain-containing protein [Planctomycetota bacterium]